MSARTLTRTALAAVLLAGVIAAPSAAATAAPITSTPGYTVVSVDEPAAGNTYDSASAYCPSNMAAVGGGYTTTGGAMTLTDLGPIAISGWAVFVYNSSPQEGTVTAYAECSSRVRNDHEASQVAFYPAAHRETTRTRRCGDVALAVGAEGSSQGILVNRLEFARDGKSVTGGVYNSTSQVGSAYLYRLCARRPATVIRRHNVDGTSTSRNVTGYLRCPVGTAFTEGGFAMSSARARVVESRPFRGGTRWTVTARFPAARRSNTLTVSGACIV